MEAISSRRNLSGRKVFPEQQNRRSHKVSIGNLAYDCMVKLDSNYLLFDNIPSPP